MKHFTFATVQDSKHPDVPNGSRVWVRTSFAGGYRCMIRSSFASAYDLNKRYNEVRTIWLDKNQVKFTG